MRSKNLHKERRRGRERRKNERREDRGGRRERE
jgi:hypothetical protein